MRRWVVAGCCLLLAAAAGAADQQMVSISLRHLPAREAAVWLGCPLVLSEAGDNQTIEAWPAQAAPVPWPSGLTSLAAYDHLDTLLAAGSDEAIASLRRIVAELDAPFEPVRLEAALCSVKADRLPPGEPDAMGWYQAALEPDAAQALVDSARSRMRHAADSTTGQTTKLAMGRQLPRGGVRAMVADVHTRFVGQDRTSVQLAIAFGTSEAMPTITGRGVPVMSAASPGFHALVTVPAGRAVVLVPRLTSAPLLPPERVSAYAECPLLGAVFGRDGAPGEVEALVLTPRRPEPAVSGQTRIIPLRFLRPSVVAFVLGQPIATLQNGRLVVDPRPVERRELPPGLMQVPAGVDSLCGCDDLRALIAKGTPKGLAELADMARMFDLPAKTVHLTASVCRVPVDGLPTASLTDPGWHTLVLAPGTAATLLRDAQDRLDAVAMGSNAQQLQLLLPLVRQATRGGRELASCLRLTATPRVTGQLPNQAVSVALSVGGSSVILLDGGTGAQLPVGGPDSLDTEVRVPDGHAMVLWPTAVRNAPDQPLLAELPLLGPLLGRALPAGTVEVLVITPRVVTLSPTMGELAGAR